MTKEQVCARILEIGILPAVRVPTAEGALSAAGHMVKWGIPIVELTMTVWGTIGAIEELRRTVPNLIVRAGSVLDTGAARGCVDAWMAFITSPGFDAEVVEFKVKHKVAAIPGAQVAGPEYVRALRHPFPRVALIASGGVNQQNAGQFIRVGATALGMRGELIPPEAIERRDENWIHELAGRFPGIVAKARAGMAE